MRGSKTSNRDTTSWGSCDSVRWILRRSRKWSMNTFRVSNWSSRSDFRRVQKTLLRRPGPIRTTWDLKGHVHHWKVSGIRDFFKGGIRKGRVWKPRQTTNGVEDREQGPSVHLIQNFMKTIYSGFFSSEIGVPSLHHRLFPVRDTVRESLCNLTSFGFT